MASPKVVVYAGPTLSPDEVRGLLPNAQVRPPVARGDLLGADWNRGDTAIIIDGFFRERRSVGHKEILWLLGEGVDVIGSASMGALRAAELAPHGMRGVGAVYEMYVGGEVDGDDEVAVLHGPAELGYQAQTVAMVNLRFGCRSGAIPAEDGRQILEVAKALPFTHRTWPDLASSLSQEVLGSLATLQQRIRAGEWDLKRLDAVAALKSASSTGERLPLAVAHTSIMLSQLLARRSRREYAPGRWMSDLDVLNAARLFDDDYPDLHEQVLAGLLRTLAEKRGLTLEEYARLKLGVPENTDLPDILAAWLTPAELAGGPSAESLWRVMVRVWPVWHSTDWRPAVLDRMRAAKHWDEWCGIVVDADEAAEQARYRVVVPPPALCAKLHLRHWLRPDISAELEVARRGFVDLEDLGRVASRFFAYDIQRRRQ